MIEKTQRKRWMGSPIENDILSPVTLEVTGKRWSIHLSRKMI